MRDQISRGADWIKVYADRSYFKTPEGSFRSLPNFTVEELTAIVDQAHRTRREGRRALASRRAATPWRSAAGVDSIEHGDVLDDATIQEHGPEAGLPLCPTLTVMDYVAGPRSKTNPIWDELQQAAPPTPSRRR